MKSILCDFLKQNHLTHILSYSEHMEGTRSINVTLRTTANIAVNTYVSNNLLDNTRLQNDTAQASANSFSDGMVELEFLKDGLASGNSDIISKVISSITRASPNKSAVIIECSKCNGQKTDHCSTCHGKGATGCSSCRQEGEFSCSNCKGTGKSDCLSCDGTGEIDDYLTRFGDSSYESLVKSYGGTVKMPCASCSGKGSEVCISCHGKGTEVCSLCDGKGILPCSTCSSSGQINCAVCEGKGSQYTIFCGDCTIHSDIEYALNNITEEDLRKCIIENIDAVLKSSAWKMVSQKTVSQSEAEYKYEVVFTYETGRLIGSSIKDIDIYRLLEIDHTFYSSGRLDEILIDVTARSAGQNMEHYSSRKTPDFYPDILLWSLARQPHSGKYSTFAPLYMSLMTNAGLNEIKYIARDVAKNQKNILMRKFAPFLGLIIALLAIANYDAPIGMWKKVLLLSFASIILFLSLNAIISIYLYIRSRFY